LKPLDWRVLRLIRLPCKKKTHLREDGVLLLVQWDLQTGLQVFHLKLKILHSVM